MKKALHTSVRIDKEIYDPLKNEADEKYEGNLSFLIRSILKEHIRKGVKV